MRERNYATQMEAARKGIVTPELETVARKERMTPEELLPLVASGRVVIPANRLHTCLDPEGIGSMLRTKINVNLGVSRDCKDYDVEMQKVLSAVKLGGDAIMDLSSHGNTQPFRRKLTAECPVMIGTVPVYDSVIHYQRDLDTLTAQDFVDVVRLHAEDGVDFVTLHCGITRATIDEIRRQGRKMNIVSRGGSLVFAWMCMTGQENPFYEHYDEILDICREYDVTISLGDACRPGCLADATDVCQINELVRLGELTRRAWEKDVQVLVEGPGHVPMDQIAANMQVQQTLCKNCLVVMERYHLLDDNPDFQVCCCWLQMLADQALDRILLRCLYAFEHMLDQDKDLWDSFRREKRAINFDLSVMVSTCLLYEKVKTAKAQLLAVAPDRAAAEAQLWFQPIPLSSIPETSSELKAREYLDLD